jgi:hypothetical protein
MPKQKRRRFSWGHLTINNIQLVADRLEDMFRGKSFAVASVIQRRGVHKIEVITGCIFKADWVDGKGSLIRTNMPTDDYKGASLTFSANGVYTFITRLVSHQTGDSEYMHPYWSFDGHDEVNIRERVCGDLKLVTLKVEDDLDDDPEEWRWGEKTYAAHFGKELVYS